MSRITLFIFIYCEYATDISSYHM